MLPFCNIVIRSHKPLPIGCPKEPKTIGEHIRKRRIGLGLSQAKVAKMLQVNYESVKQWESNNVSPTVSVMPRVIDFLKYIPALETTNLSNRDKIMSACKMLGLTRDEIAKKLGVCRVTIYNWERGRTPVKRKNMTILDSLITSSLAARTAA